MVQHRKTRHTIFKKEKKKVLTIITDKRLTLYTKIGAKEKYKYD